MASSSDIEPWMIIVSVLFIFLRTFINLPAACVGDMRLVAYHGQEQQGTLVFPFAMRLKLLHEFGSSGSGTTQQADFGFGFV